MLVPRNSPCKKKKKLGAEMFQHLIKRSNLVKVSQSEKVQFGNDVFAKNMIKCHE